MINEKLKTPGFAEALIGDGSPQAFFREAKISAESARKPGSAFALDIGAVDSKGNAAERVIALNAAKAPEWYAENHPREAFYEAKSTFTQYTMPALLQIKEGQHTDRVFRAKSVVMQQYRVFNALSKSSSDPVIKRQSQTIVEGMKRNFPDILLH